MIPLFKVFMSKDVDEPLLKTLHSGWIGQGEEVKKFEKALIRQIGNPYCLSLASGTHGLHLALRLAGVGPGDEVITTPLTCTATNWPILYQGADIVWADIKADDLNIDHRSIRDKITDKTKAIICVHWGGYPCDMRDIEETTLYKPHISIIEDAAHAFGAEHGDLITGACDYSDYTIFSFQAIKHLTTIDGGALFVNNPAKYSRGKLLRWYGIDRENPNKQDMRCEDDIKEWGYKYHMNDACATIGLANLKNIRWILDMHRSNASYYQEALKNVSGLTLVQSKADRESAYWLFTILVDNRDDFIHRMTEKEIHVSRVHERNDIHSCVEQFKTELPVLDSVIDNIICIPVGWWVSREDREYIAYTIKQGW